MTGKYSAKKSVIIRRHFDLLIYHNLIDSKFHLGENVSAGSSVSEEEDEETGNENNRGKGDSVGATKRVSRSSRSATTTSDDTKTK